eukprot:TRINITY_DN18602_c0_g1_i1.p1 TRINITY_DN18602_c0_g1~~TRINITY_DN18602_c0_g1_i1.p1  ORF type:complete len:126 (+),score=5.71 TRINITY_DN18602_c0_g1_i1:34-411(+)
MVCIAHAQHLASSCGSPPPKGGLSTGARARLPRQHLSTRRCLTGAASYSSDILLRVVVCGAWPVTSCASCAAHAQRRRSSPCSWGTRLRGTGETDAAGLAAGEEQKQKARKKKRKRALGAACPSK